MVYGTTTELPVHQQTDFPGNRHEVSSTVGESTCNGEFKLAVQGRMGELCQLAIAVVAAESAEKCLFFVELGEVVLFQSLVHERTFFGCGIRAGAATECRADFFVAQAGGRMLSVFYFRCHGR